MPEFVGHIKETVEITPIYDASPLITYQPEAMLAARRDALKTARNIKLLYERLLAFVASPEPMDVSLGGLVIKDLIGVYNVEAEFSKEVGADGQGYITCLKVHYMRALRAD